MGLTNGQHDFTPDGAGYTPHVLIELRPVRDPAPQPGPMCRLKRALKALLRTHGFRNMGMEFVEPGFIEELRLKEQEKASRTHAA